MALLVGVVMGSLIIPPVIDLLNHAYGFAGALHYGAPTLATALPAPQATLISALAKGVITGQLDWTLLGVGVLVGIVLIVVDESLRAAKRGSVPPLAVGLGIYLPSSTTAFVVVGAVVGWAYDPLGRPAAPCRCRQAARRAAGVRPDRGREPVGRGACRPDRGDRQGRDRWACRS